MATYNLTPKDIYDAQFDKKMRGFDPEQVDEMLDDIIRDYETYQEEILNLREENEFLRSKIAKMQSQPNSAESGETKRIEPINVPEAKMADTSRRARSEAPQAKSNQQTQTQPQSQSGAGTNVDMLKRISRLELAVFGPNPNSNQ
jgi:DivIVA domain